MGSQTSVYIQDGKQELSPTSVQTSGFCIYFSRRNVLFVRKELFIVRVNYIAFFQDL